MKLGAIEAGGTKFVVCIGNEKGEVLERESFPTEAPEKTMENVFKFFDGKEIEALGVGSFGPIDPDLTSPTDAGTENFIQETFQCVKIS